MAYGACDDPTRAMPRRMSFLIGADGRIEQVHAKVNAVSHPAELLASL
jgi:peroxiredoxin